MQEIPPEINKILEKDEKIEFVAKGDVKPDILVKIIFLAQVVILLLVCTAFSAATFFGLESNKDNLGIIYYAAAGFPIIIFISGIFVLTNATPGIMHLKYKTWVGTSKRIIEFNSRAKHLFFANWGEVESEIKSEGNSEKGSIILKTSKSVPQFPGIALGIHMNEIKNMREIEGICRERIKENKM